MTVGQELVARSCEACPAPVQIGRGGRNDSDSGAVIIRLKAPDIARAKDLQCLAATRTRPVPTPAGHDLARRVFVQFHKIPNPAPASSELWSLTGLRVWPVRGLT